MIDQLQNTAKAHVSLLSKAVWSHPSQNKTEKLFPSLQLTLLKTRSCTVATPSHYCSPSQLQRIQQLNHVFVLVFSVRSAHYDLHGVDCSI